MSKNIGENIELVDLTNQRLKNRNIDKEASLKKLQIEMLESHKMKST